MVKTITAPMLWRDEKTGETIVAETEWAFDGGMLVGARFLYELHRFRETGCKKQQAALN